MPEPLIGSTLGGCQILEVIGHGGMGIIYKARQKSLDRIVALKVLAPKLANDINFVARFQREARAIARVNHPNILAVYDVGSEHDIYYMIMELIDGESLAELQSRLGGPLKTEDACQFVRAAAQGLEAAQATGITHRDIKPENLMLTKKGVVKVSDFGLAKEADSSSTSTDAVMGTPAFMSPEQCDGKKVDGRSDIYSLGGTFYKLVTGRLPFEAETAMSMMYRHKHEALVPPKEIVPAIPEPLSVVIVRMMAKKREQRYQGMNEVVAAIDEALKIGRGEAPSPAPTIAMGSDPHLAAPRELSGVPILLPSSPPADRGGDLPPRGAVSGHTSISRRYEEPPPGAGVRSTGTGPRHSERLGRPGGGTIGPSPTAASSAKMSPASFVGAAGTEDGFTLASRGDDLITRGDRLGGLKCYRQALQTHGLDGATRQRIEQEIQNEIKVRRQAGENLLRRGLLVEAGREFRLLLDLDPKEEAVRASLKEIDGKLSTKRTLINDMRTAIAGLQFEQAIQLWDRTPLDLRDESLGKQIEHLRGVIVPSLKLCEQGELYNEQGRLEEAIATFQDALKIDENCERARRGLNEAEMKLHRIENYLKEGYEFHLKQDYARAIEVWKPILQLRPGHPQAVKSIVDSYAALAQAKRIAGDLKGALAAYSGARDVDPQNRTVSRLYDEMTDLHDKEQALIDRASEASMRGRGGEAIRYWKEVQRINPANKSARQTIGSLSKERSKRLVKALALLVVVAALGWGGYQFAIEYKAKADILELIDKKQFDAALKLIRKTSWPIMRTTDKAVLENLERDAQIGAWLSEAEHLEQEGKLTEAAELIEKVIETLRVNGERYKPQAAKLRVQALLREGETAIEERRWKEATKAFQNAKTRALSEDAQNQLSTLADQAQKALSFIDAIESGKKKMEDNKRIEAIEQFKEALRLRPEHAFVKEMLRQRLSFDPNRYEEHLKEATQRLGEPWKPEALDEALKALKLAQEADPTQKLVDQLNRYALDMKICADNKMVLFNRAKPEEAAAGGTWYVRSEVFCIDRYEYPNEKGTAPRAATWLEAKSECESRDKKLCSVKQWKDACSGKAYASPYPFTGDAHAQCNWASGEAKASGTFAACYNTIGAYDMSGNLAEWVLDSEGTQANHAGGSFKSEAADSRCLDFVLTLKTKKSAEIGFRCCKPLLEQK